MRYSLLFSIAFVLLGTGSLTTHAADLTVESGKNETITAERNLTESDKYENKGTVTVSQTGRLTIGDGVTNVESPGEGILGLNLGVVNSTGSIDSEIFLRFQAGSQIAGSLISTDNIAFDGISTITGKVQAEKLILNAAGNEKSTDYFEIDLTGTDSSLSADELLVNVSTKITAKSGKTLELESLYIGGTNTELIVSESMIVNGNYTGVSGTTIKSKGDANGKYTGIIQLLGGGTPEDGENNVIAQSKIYAGELQVKNNTVITQNLEVTGNFRVLGRATTEDDEDTGETVSRTLLNGALLVNGKTTIENGGILRFNIDDSETGKLHTYGYYNYTGVFLGGFDMEAGSVMDVAEEDQTITLALGNSSTIAAGAEIKAGNLAFSGVSPTDDTSGKMQEVENRGSISLAGMLQLSNIKLSNIDSAVLEVNSIKLLGSSVLGIAGSSKLKFTGDKRLLDIGASAQVSANGMTLEFDQVEVVNKNTSGSSYAITASSLIFGEGSSLSGGGFYNIGSVKFKKDSTLKLNGTNYYSLESGSALFETGSIVELTIGSNGIGPLLTEGKITMEEGVILEVTDGSNYAGRTRQYQIFQGAKDSVYKELTMADSLFFELNQTIIGDEGGLWVEIVKVNELVDYADSYNQRNISTAIDTMLNEGRVSENQSTIFNALMRIASDDQFRRTLDELSGSTRENAVLFALSSPWERAFNSIGFNRLSLALPDCSPESEDPILRGQKKSWLPNVSKPKWNRPRWSFSHDLWADLYYDYTDFSSDGNAPGGRGNRGGFHAGTALPSPSRESLLGISVGYSAGEYKQAHDKVDVDDFQLGVYGGVNLFSRNLQLRGYIGYGTQDYKYKRAPQVGNYEPLPVFGKTDGDSMAAAIYLIRPMDMSPRYLFKPMMGFDLQRITQDGFSETGVSAVALSYDDVSLSRVMWRLGASGDYEYSDRAELNWRFLAGLKVAGDNSVNSTHRFMSPGNDPFKVGSISLGDYAFDFGLGGNWKLNQRRTVLLFLDYNANFMKNGSKHTSSMGILWKR